MKNNKLNILFLASWYPNRSSTQAGNFIQQHARCVSSKTRVCVIHAVAIENISKEDITTEWNNNVYEVIIYYPKPKKSKLKTIVSYYQKAKKQREFYLKAYNIAIKEFGYFDLVHVNVIYPVGIFALYLKDKFNLPYIITEHWTAFLGLTNKKFNFLENYYIKNIAKEAELITPVSNNLKEQLIKFGLKNYFQVIPNVVDTSIFKSRFEASNNSKIHFLHLSNLKDEHKNITGILNTIKLLSQSRTDFKLTIAGNGDTQKFQKIAAEMGISKDIICFEGEKTTHEVAELMQKNDFFLLYSNYENLPCVISESLIMGLPVISTDVGGINEMIDKSNGLLIQPKNDQELLNGLNYMLDNLNDFNRKEIAQNAFNKYSFEVVGNQFLIIYNKISTVN